MPLREDYAGRGNILSIPGEVPYQPREFVVRKLHIFSLVLPSHRRTFLLDPVKDPVGNGWFCDDDMPANGNLHGDKNCPFPWNQVFLSP